jgi:hypothetical protein
MPFIQDEFNTYYWKQNPLGQRIDEPADTNDHAMNTLKYMLSYLPDVSKIVTPKEALPKKWMQWHEVEMGDRSSGA